MDLKFLRLTEELAGELAGSGVRVYYYSLAQKRRQRVDANPIEEAGYLQLPLEDLSLISNPEVKLKIEDLNHELLRSWIEYKTIRESYQVHYQEAWAYLPVLALAFRSDDFQALLLKIQADLAQLNPRSSFEATVANALEKSLRRDSKYSRMIAFSYCFFRHLKYQEHSLLFSFLGAALYKDLGLSQVSELDEQSPVYLKHPYYSLFLLKKLPLELPAECQLLILDHHEAPDGSGFPKGKKEEHIHPLAGVLKAAEAIFKSDEPKAMIGKLLNMTSGDLSLSASTLESLRVTYSYLTGP
jgi:response regulator RpfG family c-di-GMP phosphodiesterase